MSTVILTPLFPPDPSPSALYTKLLAQKLPSEDLCVLALGHLPEQVHDVPVHTISKRSTKPARVLLCLQRLFSTAPTALIVQNGPSVELPALLLSLVKQVSIVYIVSDHAAVANQSRLRAYISKMLQARAQAIITLPMDKAIYLPPQWLPFSDIDTTTQNAHDSWWQDHVAQVTKHAYDQ